MDFRGAFVGFTYNGIHSSILGVIRVSAGKFYTDTLIPNQKDQTVEKPNNDGNYFFNSIHSKKEFTVHFSFCNITNEKKALIQALWCDGNIHDLIFDELPYKVYSAKITGQCMIKEIPGEKDSKNVYSGDGSFIFTCYYPYARSRYNFFQEYNANNLHEWSEQPNLEILQLDLDEKLGKIPKLAKFKYDEFSNENKTLNGTIRLNEEDYQDWLYDERLLKPVNTEGVLMDQTMNAKTFFGYEDSQYNNFLEWIQSSEIPDNLIYEKFDEKGNFLLYNSGDLTMPLRVWYKAPQLKEQTLTINIHFNKNEIITQDISFSNIIDPKKDYYIVVDTATKTIEGYSGGQQKTNNLYNKFLIKDNFFKLPIGESQIQFFGTEPHKIEYNYIYY